MRKLILIVFLCISSTSALNAQTSASKVFEVIKNNDLKEVKILLDQGANPNSSDEDGDNLLMYAALYSSIDCMKSLIDKGADVNAKNNLGETALMWSVHDIAKMKFLIENGADVNAKAKSGNTPLAFKNKQFET